MTGTDAAAAAVQASHALAKRPEFPEAARLLATLMQRFTFGADTDLSPHGLVAAFRFADVDRQALCDGALAFLKCRQPLADILAQGRHDGWDSAAELLTRKGPRLLRDRLLAAALTHGVVTDVEIEFLLTALRRRLLQSPDLLKARPVYDFACVLIRQCLNNGYVYFADGEETARLDQLTVDVDKMLRGDAAEGGRFILQSLYRPFHETLPDSTATIDKVSPRTLRAVLSEERHNRQEERDLADTLKRLTPIDDDTSQLVAAQYSHAPYPRWLSLPAPQPGSTIDRLRSQFPTEALAILEGHCDILIAGAGTGRQAVHAAIGYGDNARILAMDLSAPSLAYGARMANVMGVSNLQFALGDILQLDESCGHYDVIECVGVLHHMADPYAGWRALLERLRPGGLMLIGLYSAVAREVIRHQSNDPDWPGPEANDDVLRRYRRSLMTRPSDDDKMVLTDSVDFYTKSGFRDLALHVSEQTCALPDISEFMSAHGLEFHGFSLPDDTLRAYANAYPDDMPLGSLDHWWAFEQEHPDTFNGMYVFWCRK